MDKYRHFFDADSDGRVDIFDVFTIIRYIVYISLACYVVIVEGINPVEDVYTDVEITLIVVSSFGSVLLEKFISLKFHH